MDSIKPSLLEMDVAHLTSDQLLQGFIARDPVVFEFMEKNYRRKIRLMIFEMGGTFEDGDDIYGEGLVGMYDTLCKPDFKLTCNFYTFFFAICKYQWHQVLKKKKAALNYHVRHNEPTEVEDNSENLDHNIYERIFWDSFQKLNHVCKQILNGYFKEVPLHELADLLQFTYNYLRKKKSMCHAALMQIINDNNEYRDIKDELNLDF